MESKADKICRNILIFCAIIITMGVMAYFRTDTKTVVRKTDVYAVYGTEANYMLDGQTDRIRYDSSHDIRVKGRTRLVIHKKYERNHLLGMFGQRWHKVPGQAYAYYERGKQK